MTPKDYQACTWREFILRYDGYQLRRAHELEGHRSTAHWILWSSWTEEMGPMPLIHEIWPLLSDEQQIKEADTQNKEEAKRLRQKMEAEREYIKWREVLDRASQNSLN